MTETVTQLAGLSDDRRRLLELLMMQRASARTATVAQGAAADGEPVELSYAQERMWVLQQIEQGSAYNMKTAVRLPADVRVDIVEHCVRELVSRHRSLRTRFTQADDGTPRQVVEPQVVVPVRRVTRPDLPAALRDAEQQAALAFDLTAAPLLRVSLIRIATGGHLLALCVHHIVADGWSLGVVTDEFARLYSARLAGEPANLPAAFQYPDYAVWQRAELSGERARDLLGYWTGQLAGAPPVLELPTDHPRPPVRSGRGAVLPVEFGGAGIRELAATVDGTGFMVLLAAMAIVLSRYSGQPEVVIGTPISSRSRPEFQSVVGLFVNSIAVRVNVGVAGTFTDLLRQVRAAAVAGYAHQDLPFEHLVQALAPERDLRFPPVFQVQLALNDTPAPASTGGLDGERVRVDNATAKFDLNLALSSTDGQVRGMLEYATDIFDRPTMERFARHLDRVLRQAAADPGVAVTDLDLLDEAQRAAAIGAGRGGAVPVPMRCLHDLVAAQAAETPQAIAVVGDGRTLTYAQLCTQANRFAGQLRLRGVGPDTVVGVALPRGVDFVVAVLAVLTAGGAYLPLDPDHPVERQELLISEAGAAVVVTGRDLAEAVDAPVPLGLAPVADVDHLAYTIFTSGSTGTPKGVAVPHSAIVTRLAGMQHDYQLTAADVVLHKTPATFDPSVWELFWPLTTGARLVLAPPGAQRDPAELHRLITAHSVTTCHFVPAMLRAFLAQGHVPETLTRVICSGEELPPDVAARFRELSPARLDNLYGPTEAAIDVTSYRVPAELPNPLTVPIGRPVANTTVHVLDGRHRPVPAGVVGELYLGGPQLARGYLGRPGLTAAAFLPDPYGHGERLYRTGDLARRCADGRIEYCGRSDLQVKIRGHRIETGEVEAVLSGHPDVTGAVVTATADRSALVGYVTGTADPALLHDYLAARLPGYLVPGRFVLLDALPLSANGKVDRKRLPAVTAGPVAQAAYVAPATPQQTVLAEVWGDVLGVDRVGIHDNFFALGGDSIRAIRIVSLAQQRGVALAVNDMFQHPTIARVTEARRDTVPDRPRPAAALLNADDLARLEQLRSAQR